ncbi:hypothetical protein [Mycolicibacterium smegmatis]|uniref:Uncharacterized protein n=2 Tax=Mycolicibacterium smegmatis (strain ATCC 700084 / mc(2)155) TaxID=246196 RepID=I7G8L1_MYCS2|nr:hypothetical protein [Mycolicibacterium smegmatis]ABK72868.1 conserved hypothetical protein [Mycolicibacterium smegmatis MC2 155]AFP39536.1 hypothetical protein MSMEI_3072 [Mycolicibacterium smegmatis MC2 155]AIU08306.1 hypothetical protein LJ00_15680 [Mycolicibacterium smegmatis MC2 155]AIU14931.1 hypothetical protein LI99_15685 [Mycolicibacterium smegmatis]AIU21554.1 hypothetical protein LI98_15690 [Mycolicibacterium smegmatis]
MWCPSATLSMWANAWLAGVAAPDDVLDALSLWAPTHSVTAYDSAAADRTGLPWPELEDSGSMSLLQTLRTAVGRTSSMPAITIAQPVPGDVRGLPAGTQFQRDALAVGEAVVVTHDDLDGVGLVPEFTYDEFGDTDLDSVFEPESRFEPEPRALSWTVYSVPRIPPGAYIELGEAEYELRDAVRSAADALVTLRAGAGFDVEDPRGMVEQILAAGRAHRVPDHAPTRAVRVLENAAHVDAIIAVSAGLIPSGLQSSSEVQIADSALRPLTRVVRSARMAALEAILHSAWRS